MAFFKFRKAAGESQAPAPAPESVDAMRRRARYRLAGAAMLVLAAVVGFPLLFDNQPRPIAVDIAIEIPDKAKVKPLSTAPQPTAPMVQGTVTPPPVAPAAVVAPVAQVESKPEPKAETKPVAAPVVAKPVEKPAETAKATAPAARFIVQVGAFADVVKAREARQKLEKAGLKTYTQVVETPDG